MQLDSQSRITALDFDRLRLDEVQYSCPALQYDHTVQEPSAAAQELYHHLHVQYSTVSWIYFASRYPIKHFLSGSALMTAVQHIEKGRRLLDRVKYAFFLHTLSMVFGNFQVA
jgi:hypothetical protein